MKKFLLIVSASVLFVMWGCKRQLELEPLNAVSLQNAITDAESARSAVRGAYSTLQSGDYYGDKYLIYADMYADNIKDVGTFQTTDGQVFAKSILANNIQLNNTWIAIYAGIGRCNFALSKIPNVADLDPAEKTSLLAELRFLRGLLYFDLVRYWGGVPLVLEPTESPDELQKLPRSTEAQVYTQIIDDLSFAETNLTNNTPNAPNRATSMAAAALLARVQLYRQNWSEALAKANKVINSGADTLVGSNTNLYLNKNSSESIFELSFTVNDNNVLARAGITGTGITRYNVTADLVAAYDAQSAYTDNRYKASVAFPKGYPNQPFNYAKYFRVASGDDNVILIRLAEMHLIRAEARAQLGVDPIADIVSQEIDPLRTRAGLMPLAPPADYAGLLTAIEAERRLELSFEGHRFFDLKRTGRAQVLIPEFQAEPFRLLWPIPYNQIVVNPNLTQNPGY